MGYRKTALQFASIALVTIAVACSGPSVPTLPVPHAPAASQSGAVAGPPPGASSGDATRAASINSGAASAVQAPSSTAPRPAAPLLQLQATREVDDAIRSLAIDPERGKVAALGTTPWLLEDGVWRRIPVPEALSAQDGERDVDRIYFGRDYQPRIMGARHDEGGARQLYMRFRYGRWQLDANEQAAFAGKPHAALYGVLGWDDPEVLCKDGAFCLIKQRSGWSKAPLPAPPSDTRRIDLGADAAYALLDDRLLRLEMRSGSPTTGVWTRVGGDVPWKGQPAAAWLHGDGAWVSVPDDRAVYRYDGAWTRHASIVGSPQGLWSDKPNEVWVAGSEGAAHYDGRQWHRIAEVAGPLVVVRGLAKRLWFAGASGVWAGRR